MNQQSTASARAFIKLVSIHPVHRELTFATIGGHTVILPNKKEVIFDWTTSQGSFKLLENGHIEIEWEQIDFDDDYYEDSNEFPLPNWSEFIEGEIEEVYYEAGYTIEENGKVIDENHIEFDLAAFAIVDIDNDWNETAYEFSNEKIENYNKKIRSIRE